ncbi:MAG: hypothetical protein E7218_05130 [Anaerofustis stercorihominis]|nr:hypothetical protein [Anaerofustis stercorihominis]
MSDINSNKQKINYSEIANTIWQEYERGVEHLVRMNLYNICDDSYRFYSGNQWHGLKGGDEVYPAYNVIKSVVDYKVSGIAQKGFSITYQPSDLGGGFERRSRVCELLTLNAAKNWEKLKLDKHIWDIIHDGAVFGSSFVYFYYEAASLRMDLVDSTNVLLSDEQQQDIQKQKYIILVQRQFVGELRDTARKYGMNEDEIRKILPDDDTRTYVGTHAKEEVKGGSDNEKCTSLLKLYKKDGEIYAVRVVKNTVIMPEVKLVGLTKFPVAQFVWKADKGSCRGLSEVYPIIPNQIEINKSLVRLLSGIKQYAFPHIVYDSSVLSKDSVRKLSTVGANIGINNMKMQKIDDVIGYMQPAQIHPLADNIISQMIALTRELSGAGDAVLGTVNPENASGAAIIAVRDAAELPLNRHVSSLRQFVEDVAIIWLDMLRAYSSGGVTVAIIGDDGKVVAEKIEPEELSSIMVDIRIDISSISPYSKYAREDALSKLFMQGAITFEEFVSSLDDDSASPKGKLKDILNRRHFSSEAMDNGEKA